MGHIKGFIAFLGRYLDNFLWLIKRVFGTCDFLPHTWITRIFARAICGASFMNPLCDNVLFLIGGPELKQFNASRLVVYMSHTPAGTSTWNIIHWAQMYRSGKVQKYDYGSAAENMKYYGQNEPPLYNLR